MTEIDLDSIPRVVLVFNGTLKMSPGKMAAQAFQACQRLYRTAEADGLEHVYPGESPYVIALAQWSKHTTTISRVAKTTNMFELVCAEVPGVVMIDEGFTEVDPDTPTVFASWPAPKREEHKLLSNAKVQLMRDVIDPLAGWTDEQIAEVGSAIESACGEGAFGGDVADQVVEMMRKEAANRHIKFPHPYQRNDATAIAPEHWPTYFAGR